MKEKTYKIKVVNGTLPDDTSWWTEEDWERHRTMVEQMKKDGTYLKEWEGNITVVHNPLLDGDIEDKVLPSWGFEVIDFSKDFSKDLGAGNSNK